MFVFISFELGDIALDDPVMRMPVQLEERPSLRSPLNPGENFRCRPDWRRGPKSKGSKSNKRCAAMWGFTKVVGPEIVGFPYSYNIYIYIYLYIIILYTLYINLRYPCFRKPPCVMPEQSCPSSVRVPPKSLWKP